MNSLAIVVTGLPASGKTTVARRVAAALGLPCLDKDDFLEALFETSLVPDVQTRRGLSRRSDGDFIDAAAKSGSSVLVSHWRNATCEQASGTPTDWIASSFDSVIELYCQCPVEIATGRFINRQRHPSHHDGARSEADIRSWFSLYATDLPIGLGQLVETQAGLDGQAGEACRTIKSIIA